MLKSDIETWQWQKQVTEVKKGDNEHSEINIGINVIALQVINANGNIQKRSDIITPRE